MASYTEALESFSSLLHWHLITGSRPLGDKKAGHEWTNQEFAGAVRAGITDKAIRNWRRGRNLPTRTIDQIERALFGNSPGGQHAVWRSELRAAYEVAVQRGRGVSTSTEQSTIGRRGEHASVTLDPDVFPLVVGEGLLMILKGEVFLPPALLNRLSHQCRNQRLISEITDPDQDLEEGESLMGKLLAHLVIPNLRTKTWDQEGIQRVVDEAGRHLHTILLRKSASIGLYTMHDDVYVVDAGALDSVIYNLVGRFSITPTASQVYREVYESWKELIAGAIQKESGQDRDYIDILSLFIYSMAYDNGSVGHCAEVCAEWQISC